MRYSSAARRLPVLPLLGLGLMSLGLVGMHGAALGQPRPDVLWSRTYGGDAEDHARAVRQTPDGGYLVAGLTTSYYYGEACDGVVLKLNAEGEVQWQRVYHRGWDDRLFALEVMPDGGFAAVGLSFVAPTNCEAWVLRADSLGEPIWEQTFGGWMNDQGYALAVTADGGFAVAGINATRGGGRYEEYLVRLDGNGNILWENSWGVRAINVEARSVRECADGGFIITGGSVSYGEWNTPFNMFIVRTDANGQTVWARQYGGPGNEFATDAVCLEDGGFAVVGYTTSVGAGGRDLCLMRLNAGGQRLWTRTYGGPADDAAFQIMQTAEGGFLIGGYTASFGQGSSDLCLLKVNARGMRRWSRVFGGSESERPWSNQCFQRTSDGGYVLTGTVGNWAAGSTDMVVVKTGPDRHGLRNGIAREVVVADYRWTETFVLGDGEPPSPASEPPAATSLIARNYPNPFNPATEIAYDLAEAGHVTLRVYNVVGQSVATLVDAYVERGHHTAHFDGSALPSGVYLYTIEAGGLGTRNRMLLLK